MVFCQYNYKNFHNKNKEKHPIQPPTIENWCKMVNDNQNYCQNFNLWKWTVFYFWVNFGRMKYCNLPSFHPYWKNERKKVAKKQLNQMIIKYNECKKNPEKIKYYFNSSATLDSIKENVKKHKEELKK